MRAESSAWTPTFRSSRTQAFRSPEKRGNSTGKPDQPVTHDRQRRDRTQQATAHRDDRVLQLPDVPTRKRRDLDQPADQLRGHQLADRREQMLDDRVKRLDCHGAEAACDRAAQRLQRIQRRRDPAKRHRRDRGRHPQEHDQHGRARAEKQPAIVPYTATRLIVGCRRRVTGLRGVPNRSAVREKR
jgi:hypothetical protein